MLHLKIINDHFFYIKLGSFDYNSYICSRLSLSFPPLSVMELAPKYFVNRPKMFDNGIEFEITNHYIFFREY